MDDHAYRETKEGVKLAHPLRVALGQIVVDGDHVHAASRQRIQVNRQSRHQRLAFTGLHLGDLALVQYRSADQLHVEMTHVEHTLAGLAHYRKSFRQDLGEGLF